MKARHVLCKAAEHNWWKEKIQERKLEIEIPTYFMISFWIDKNNKNVVK